MLSPPISYNSGMALAPRKPINRRAGLVVAALAVVGLAFAGCGGSSGPGVASAGGTTPTTAASGGGNTGSGTSSSQYQQAVAYSACMQKHGVPDYPEPNSNGQTQISGGPGSDLDPNSPAFQKAQKDCQSLQPKLTPQQQQQHLAGALKYSQCMRAHGVPDFPDPKTSANGGISITLNGGPGSDLDPNSPTFQKAQQTCGHYLPGGGPKGSTSSSGSANSGAGAG